MAIERNVTFIIKFTRKCLSVRPPTMTYQFVLKWAFCEFCSLPGLANGRGANNMRHPVLCNLTGHLPKISLLAKWSHPILYFRKIFWKAEIFIRLIWLYVKLDYISSFLPHTACLWKICRQRYLGPKLAIFSFFWI